MPYADRKAYNAYMRKHMRERYERRRAEAIKELGGACVHCGATELLQFDHVCRTSKSACISDLLCKSKKALYAELEKCQLLCMDCHLSKTAREGYGRKNEEDSFDYTFPPEELELSSDQEW